MTKTSVGYLQGLIERYGEQFPRRTVISTFEAVDKKAVARQNLKLAYDKKTGYFGSQVRGDAHVLTVSEFDLLLAICEDGSYRILPPPEKHYFPKKLLYCERFDP